METTVVKRSYRPLVVGLVLLAVLQVLDLWTTFHLVGLAGNEAEANPIAKFFLERGWMWQMKAIVFSAVAGMFWLARDRIQAVRFVWCGVLIYTCVVIWNLGQF